MTTPVETPYFNELKELARYTRRPSATIEGRDRFIRFLDTYAANPATDPVVDSLCTHFGLFPYMSPSRERLSTREALAFEFHRPELPNGDDNFVFHEDQAQVFYRLLDGDSIVLSAPTSFGKSAILDAVIASRKWENIVVIVPTIALIDEVRRRISRFRDSYSTIIHPTQAAEDRNVYVLTQERFLEFQELPPIDFFMIDEFYKLGAQERDEQRMSMLNIAWQRLRATGAQYYLAGPNVESLAPALDEELHSTLIVSKYRTVAVNVDDRSHVEPTQRISDLEQQWGHLEGPTLLFVFSQKRAEQVAEDISQFSAGKAPTDLTEEVSDWLSEHYHPAWRIVTALKGGVGTHTGAMPRSLQRMMVRLFEAGEIEALTCTSTLIEGVNTSARNVVIYDKAISNKAIDYFTYSNVQGRAGRMRHHFVGNVLTYMPPPEPERVEVDIPIESQPEDAPLSSLIQLPEERLTQGSRNRLQEIVEQSDLSLATIRANRGFDPAMQIEAARKLRGDDQLRAQLSWIGQPSSGQAYATLEFAFEHLLPSSHRRGMNAGKLSGMLQAVKETGGDFKALVSRQEQYKFPKDELSDVVRNVLTFQRNWMGFHVPSMLKAAQRIYNEIAGEYGEGLGNYEYYSSQVESLFLEPGVLDLDEYGLPLPVTLTLINKGMRISSSIEETLDSFVQFVRRRDVRDQLSRVELWFVDDVLAGVGH